MPELNSDKVHWKDLLSKREYFLMGAFFVIVLLIFYITFFTPNYYQTRAPYRMEVNRGDSFGSIAEKLEKDNIIPSASNLKIAAFIYGAEKKVKAARYYIPNGLSYLGLIDYFLNGKADYLRAIKIFDASTITGIASRLHNEAYIDSAAFVNLSDNDSLIKSLNINGARSIEGYLLPKQYFIFERSTPQEAMNKLLDGMREFIKDTLLNSINKSGYSLHQILTMASIVNGESQKYDELPRIAGVYYNRLKRGMRLQADPTIQYLLKAPWRRLSYVDLRINSPYNTYLYAGLPPGPINSPGKKAIMAAVYPEKNDYFYFVADGKGGHKFAVTFSEHLKNVEEYKKLLKK